MLRKIKTKIIAALVVVFATVTLSGGAEAITTCDSVRARYTSLLNGLGWQQILLQERSNAVQNDPKLSAKDKQKQLIDIENKMITTGVKYSDVIAKEESALTRCVE